MSQRNTNPKNRSPITNLVFDQSKWWCVHFGQERVDSRALRKLHLFLSRYSSQRILGNQRVFLDMSESQGRHAFPLFQSKVYRVAESLGLSPDSWQFGLGKSIEEAWVHTRWRTLSLEALPIEAVTDFLKPLDFEGVPSNHKRRIQRLRSLGVSSLQDLIELPESVLAAQGGSLIAEFARDHFERRHSQSLKYDPSMRDLDLERITEDSFTSAFSNLSGHSVESAYGSSSFAPADFIQSSRAFQLEDWIPEEYLQVG